MAKDGLKHQAFQSRYCHEPFMVLAALQVKFISVESGCVLMRLFTLVG